MPIIFHGNSTPNQQYVFFTYEIWTFLILNFYFFFLNALVEAFCPAPWGHIVSNGPLGKVVRADCIIFGDRDEAIVREEATVDHDAEKSVQI